VAVHEHAGFLTVMSDYPETPRDDVAAPPSDTQPQLVAETPSLPDGDDAVWRMAVGNQQEAAIPFPEPDTLDAGPLPLVFEASGLAPATAETSSTGSSTAEGSSAAEAAVVTVAAGAMATRRLGVWWDELLAWLRTLISAAVYATLIVTFGFQVARVEGESMAPTLANQDRLIVNKLAYRLGPPRRGDIVMLHYPVNPDKSFVKRVIAEEGDTVKIENGRVYVNDVPMPDEYVIPRHRSHDDLAPQVIKDGYYFVMGDHRNNSSDSRHWGEVPKKYIIGRVQLRWWPIPEARLF